MTTTLLRQAFTVLVACMAGTIAPPATAQDSRPKPHLSDFRHGDPAPQMALRSIDGVEVSTTGVDERILVLLFARAEHDRSLEAAEAIAGALLQAAEQPPVRWAVVLDRGSDVARLDPRLQRLEPAPLVVHDQERSAFGGFGVVVVPGVAIIDPDGRIAHTVSGPSPRLGEIVTDALELAAGRIGIEQFQRALEPAASDPDNDPRIRAHRLATLASRLQGEGRLDDAGAEYREAMELDPRCVPARLGLASLLQERGQLAEAAALYQAVLFEQPVSGPAATGLATVRLLQSPPALDEAERLAGDVLAREPANARAHYLLGRVHQEQGHAEMAMDHYRRAAELLLDTAATGRPSQPREGARPPFPDSETSRQ